MDFKIDTRDTFTVITPTFDEITVKMTDELQQTIDKIRQSGSLNFIVDCEHCTSLATDAMPNLASVQDNCYAEESSLVYTNISPDLISQLKKSDLYDQLNIAPKMIEAIDIVSMEILERDLMREDE